MKSARNELRLRRCLPGEPVEEHTSLIGPGDTVRGGQKRPNPKMVPGAILVRVTPGCPLTRSSEHDVDTLPTSVGILTDAKTSSSTSQRPPSGTAELCWGSRPRREDCRRCWVCARK